MRINDIFEDAESDLVARREAVETFNTILSYLASNELYDVLSLQSFAGGSYLVDGLDLPQALKILLIPETEASFFAMATDRKGVTVPMIAMAAVSENGGREAVPEKLRTMRRDFMHEYHHFLMRMRSGHLGRSGEAVKGGDYQTYFNDPDEFNSFFQEAAGEFEEKIRSIARADGAREAEALRRMTHWSDRQLLALFFKYLEPSFMEWLTPERQKALTKRAVRFIRETIRPMISQAVTART